MKTFIPGDPYYCNEVLLVVVLLAVAVRLYVFWRRRSENAELRKDKERLDWLETHDLPRESPNITFAVGEIARFPWGAARLEEILDYGLRWTKVDWREAIDAARSVQTAQPDADEHAGGKAAGSRDRTS